MVPAIKEMLSSHEALRKLGFLPEDIHVTLDASSTAVVILKTQDLEFFITCGQFNGGVDEFARQWSESVEQWNQAMPSGEMDEIWKNSFACRHLAQLIMALKNKGFYIPEVEKQSRNWN